MICNERSKRMLPGLSQALSWLREGLPPADGAPLSHATYDHSAAFKVAPHRFAAAPRRISAASHRRLEAL
jgi:hypothetical protein